MLYQNCRLALWIITGITLLFTGTRLVAEELYILTVVWATGGDLWGWKQGDAAPVKLAEGDVAASDLVQGAKSLDIAPDGTHVAFIRGYDLWISDWRAAREIVSNSQLSLGEQGQPHIVAVSWRDSDTLYFNTGVNGVSRPGIVVRDDWWRVDIRTGKVEQILSPGEGGGFTFSSNGQYAALVVPGRYDERDGEVELFDLTAGDKREVFSFPAVSTGANYAFYPQIFWEADSLALRLVIPDKDLVYDDSTRPSVLWQVSVEGSVQQLGAVIASFYGLPQWSADGQFIAYIRRTEGENNQLELILARGDGNEAVVYASGEVGALGEPRWLPDANLFVYERGQPGMYWLGQPGEPPVPFLGLLYAPEFLADGWYVYMTEERELRYAQIGGSDSTLITVLGDSYLVFDVALAFNHPTR